MKVLHKSHKTALVLLLCLLSFAAGNVVNLRSLTVGHFFDVAHADPDPCTNPSSLTVSGAAHLDGDVFIGTESEPVDHVGIWGNEMQVNLTGAADSYYEQGLINGYGDPVGACGTLLATPALTETDQANNPATSYFMGLLSTGVVAGIGDGGFFSAGHYNSDGESGFLPDCGLDGGILAATYQDSEGDTRFKAAMQLVADEAQSGAFIGAEQSDGTWSSIMIDENGSIVIQLGPAGAKSAPGPSNMPRNRAILNPPATLGGLLGAQLPQPDAAYIQELVDEFRQGSAK